MNEISTRETYLRLGKDGLHKGINGGVTNASAVRVSGATQCILFFGRRAPETGSNGGCPMGKL